MKWLIGCSGFYYREWKEVFYPKGLAQKDWFKYYATHFNTLEINSTFYKMPTQKSFDKWYSESTPGFVFTLKAPRLITHYKQLKACDELLNDFYERAFKGLKDKLGCILFQFPPKFDFSEERLNLLINTLNPEYKNIVEFRNLSWFNDIVYTSLSNAGIVFSGLSYPSTLPDEVIKNNSTIYYRFHGKPILYKSEYPQEVIQNLVNQIPDDAEEAYIYFNNTWGIGALNNANFLIDITR